MNLLVLQFTHPRQSDPQPVFRHDVGVLAALLKADGFAVRLAAMPGFRQDLLRAALEAHAPQCVLAELNPYSVAAARRTLAELAETYRLPVVAFGQYATCRPRDAVSMPAVKALALGEHERTLLELFRAWREGRSAAGLPGLWVRADGRLAKGDLPELRDDLDSLPFPDREVFDYDRIVRREKTATFKAARGCDQWCAYCVNDWYMDLYAGKGPFLRRRSVGNLLDEVQEVVRRYPGARAVVFCDHCFATDAAWLEAFAAAYARRVGLPYGCHVRLNRLDERTAGLLADSGCRWAEVQIPSGSRFIRDEIYTMRTDEEQIVSGCRLLRRAGLRVVAEAFVGNPYESEITVGDTLELLRRAEADEVRPRVFYPTPGSRAAELCAENGWISGRGEEHYWEGRSVLDMPSFAPEQIDAAARKLPGAGRGGLRTVLRGLLERVRRLPGGAPRDGGAEEEA